MDITDDDLPTISLSSNAPSIAEGDELTFTLTRGNNTTGELVVGVSVEDPGGFLNGNYPSEAVEAPTSVTFAPGDVSKVITLTPPDDWRDIPDSSITFTVMDEPEFEILGDSALTVQVADNDTAPQVQISFTDQTRSGGHKKSKRGRRCSSRSRAWETRRIRWKSRLNSASLAVSLPA